MLLSFHLTAFLDAKRAYGLSPKTLISYRRHAGQLVDWLDLQALPLTRAALISYTAYIQTLELALASKVAAIRDGLVFVRWLFAEELLPPFSTAKLKPRLPRRRPASYTVEQLHKLLAGASPRDRALMIVLLDTGLRAGELVQLDRDAIDPADGYFSIIGKGDKERPGWVSTPARLAIAAYMQTRTDASPALWVDQRGRGERLTPSGVHSIIKRRAQAVGLRGEVRRLLHSFRATFAKHYVARGGDLESLAKLLGHTSIVMSAHYAQLAGDELAQQKARINPLGAVLG